MADVGVIELQIHDNSKEASTGLDALGGALDRVKKSVSGGLGLGNTAKQIEEVRKAVNTAKAETNFEKVTSRIAQSTGKLNEQLKIELKEIKDTVTSGVSTGNISNGTENIVPGLERVESKMQAVQESASAYKSELADVNSRIEDSVKSTADIAQHTNETNQAIEEQIRLRKQALDAENQARLEKNYASFRELYLSNEGSWKEQVPEMYGFTPKALEEGETYAQALEITLQEVNRYVDDFIQKTNVQTGPLLRDAIDDALGIGRAAKDAKDSASVLQNAPEIMTQVQSATQRMSNEVRKGGQATTVLTENMKDLDKELKEKKKDMDGVGDASKSLSKSLSEIMFGANGLNGAFKKMFPTISQLMGRFKQLVKYRMLRSVIREIASGFREGVENVYYYSKAIGGSFASDMDSAATALLQMKNAIGAAAAPLIQSLIPYLQMAVNAFIDVVNWANQFVALLRGQATWTRAVPKTASAFKDQEKAAKGAGAAIKDLLADWDELNIIQSETGGGGGAGATSAAEDYLNMFEEVGEFNNDVRKAVEFIRDNFDEIKKMVPFIGAGILGWKVSNAFGGLLGQLGTLAGTIATVAISVKLTDMLGKAYMSSGNEAWLIADALTGAVGAALAYRLAARLAGTTAGEITAGFTLLLEGVVNVKNAADAITPENEGKAWMLAALGDIEIGIGAALTYLATGATLTGALGVGLAVTLAAMVITIPIMLEAKKKATYKKMAIDAFSQTGVNGISTEEYIKALQKRADELTEGSKVVINTSLSFDSHKESFSKNVEYLKEMNDLLKSGEGLTEEDALNFKKAWDIVITELGAMEEISFATIYAGLDEVISNGSAKIREEARQLKKEAIAIAKEIGGARGAMEEEMNQLTQSLASGTLEGDEYEKAYERYAELYSIMSKSKDTGMEDIQQRLIAGAGFDFTGEDNPLDAAIQFIKNLSEQEIVPALESAREAYESEIKSINAQYEELDMLKDAGYVDQEQYDRAKSMLDRVKALFDESYEERQKQIQSLKDSAYETVLKQAFEGRDNIDSSDKRAVDEYMKNVIDPIIAALEEAGYVIPDYYKALYDVVKEGYTQIGHEIENLDKTQLYQAIVDETSPATDAQAMRLIVAYEIDMKGTISKDSDDVSDIINSALSIDGVTYSGAIRGLAEALGWSVEDVVRHIDPSKFDLDNLEIMLEELEELRKEFEFNNPILQAGIALGDGLYSDDLNAKIRASVEIYDKAIKQIMGIVGKDVDDTVEDVNDTVEDVKPQMDMSGVTEPLEDVKQVADSARWSVEEFEKVLAEDSRFKIEDGKNVFGTGTGVPTTDRATFNVPPANPNGYVISSVALEEKDVSGGVREGTADGFRQLSGDLGSVILWLSRIYNKETTVKIAPSTTAGIMNKFSAQLANAVTGDYNE